MRNLSATLMAVAMAASIVHADDNTAPSAAPPTGNFIEASQFTVTAPVLTSLGAQQAIDAAVAEANRNRWTMSIAVSPRFVGGRAHDFEVTHVDRDSIR